MSWRPSLAVLLAILVAVVVLFVVMSHNRRRAIKALVRPEPEGPALGEGDRVFVTGGYDPEPAWLAGGEGYAGTLERFIPGQNDEPAAVVRTDTPVTAEGTTGELLVMQLRWVGATWHSGAVAHVELCDFEPEAKPWGERRQGAWVESHATVRLLE